MRNSLVPSRHLQEEVRSPLCLMRLSQPRICLFPPCHFLLPGLKDSSCHTVVGPMCRDASCFCSCISHCLKCPNPSHGPGKSLNSSLKMQLEVILGKRLRLYRARLRSFSFVPLSQLVTSSVILTSVCITTGHHIYIKMMLTHLQS